MMRKGRRCAEFRRSYINRTCLSSDFVARQVNARIRCEQLWRQLRAKGDWNDFLPSFENIVSLAREEAADAGGGAEACPMTR
jgi:carboxypeptidase Taq